jgi:hypothetical protein
MAVHGHTRAFTFNDTQAQHSGQLGVGLQVERLQHERKLERIACFHSMLALQTALKRGVGFGLESFEVPSTWSLKPLLDCEVRFKDPHTGRMVIYNKETKALRQDVLTK